MKKIFDISKRLTVAVVVLCGTLLSSCNDYLTIIPPDKIIEEHFWQTKDDVNGVLATAYLKMLEKPAVERAIVQRQKYRLSPQIHSRFSQEGEASFH